MAVPPNLLNPLSEQNSKIDTLKAWTAYNITVLCFTSPGDGLRSPPELVRTHQDYPGSVNNLRFEDITDRGVKVLWDVPKSPNGLILGMYTMSFDEIFSPKYNYVIVFFRLHCQIHGKRYDTHYGGN